MGGHPRTLGAEVRSSLRIRVNGMRVPVPRSRIADIRGLSGVRSGAPVTLALLEAMAHGPAVVLTTVGAAGQRDVEARFTWRGAAELAYNGYSDLMPTTKG